MKIFYKKGCHNKRNIYDKIRYIFLAAAAFLTESGSAKFAILTKRVQI
jgi:hypothetical protein